MDAKLLKILEECNKNIIDAETAREQIINLFSADCKGFSTGKVGDYLRCEAVYGRSKRFTIGKTYRVFRIDQVYKHHLWRNVPHMAIRDDNNNLVRIDQEKETKTTYFTLISM